MQSSGQDIPTAELRPDAPAQDPLRRLFESIPEDKKALVIVGAVLAYALLSKRSEAPAWAKGLPPVNGRVNGAWRGKGSFGHGFGPQVRHK